MSPPMLITEQRASVLYLTINRPEKRNALCMELLDRLGEALDAARLDSTLRCVVIGASGDRCFAAGGDLKELDAIRSETDTRAMSRRGRAALDRVRACPVPVVAALNGPALGGGAELAMACDLRVADANAELGFLQAQLAVTTAWGGGIDLLAAIGPARALEILAAARRIGMHEAHELGLVQRIAAPDQTLAGCLEDFLEPFRERPPQVLRGLKAVTSAGRLALHRLLAEHEETAFTPAWLHADHWSAVAASLSNRRPA